MSIQHVLPSHNTQDQRTHHSSKLFYPCFDYICLFVSMILSSIAPNWIYPHLVYIALPVPIMCVYAPYLATKSRNPQMQYASTYPTLANRRSVAHTQPQNHHRMLQTHYRIQTPYAHYLKPPNQKTAHSVNILNTPDRTRSRILQSTLLQLTPSSKTLNPSTSKTCKICPNPSSFPPTPSRAKLNTRTPATYTPPPQTTPKVEISSHTILYKNHKPLQNLETNIETQKLLARKSCKIHYTPPYAPPARTMPRSATCTSAPTQPPPPPYTIPAYTETSISQNLERTSHLMQEPNAHRLRQQILIALHTQPAPTTCTRTNQPSNTQKISNLAQT
jgi:hypothetical protein